MSWLKNENETPKKLTMKICNEMNWLKNEQNNIFAQRLPLNLLYESCLQVTDNDRIVMQQTSDGHQAIIVMPHSDSIVSTEEFQRSVLSLATNDNIVNDGSLAMMGDDVMNNTVVVTTVEEGRVEDAEEEGEMQVQG